MSNGERRLVLLMQPATAQSQLQQPYDCVHGSADLVTHGCQKSRLGSIGLLGILAGQSQLIQQTLTLTDIDPAANPPLYITFQVIIRLHPMVDIHGAGWHGQAMIALMSATHRTSRAQVLKQRGHKGPAPTILLHTRPQQAMFLIAEETGITAVAENQPALPVPGINGMGRSIHQVFDELELSTQSHLGNPTLAYLFV